MKVWARGRRLLRSGSSTTSRPSGRDSTVFFPRSAPRGSGELPADWSRAERSGALRWLLSLTGRSRRRRSRPELLFTLRDRRDLGAARPGSHCYVEAGRWRRQEIPRRRSSASSFGPTTPASIASVCVVTKSRLLSSFSSMIEHDVERAIALAPHRGSRAMSIIEGTSPVLGSSMGTFVQPCRRPPIFSSPSPARTVTKHDAEHRLRAGREARADRSARPRTQGRRCRPCSGRGSSGTRCSRPACRCRRAPVSIGASDALDWSGASAVGRPGPRGTPHEAEEESAANARAGRNFATSDRST